MIVKSALEFSKCKMFFFLLKENLLLFMDVGCNDFLKNFSVAENLH